MRTCNSTTNRALISEFGSKKSMTKIMSTETKKLRCIDSKRNCSRNSSKTLSLESAYMMSPNTDKMPNVEKNCSFRGIPKILYFARIDS
jgi:hypothetical protein